MISIIVGACGFWGIMLEWHRLRIMCRKPHCVLRKSCVILEKVLIWS